LNCAIEAITLRAAFRATTQYRSPFTVTSRHYVCLLSRIQRQLL